MRESLLILEMLVWFELIKEIYNNDLMVNEVRVGVYIAENCSILRNIASGRPITLIRMSCMLY